MQNFSSQRVKEYIENLILEYPVCEYVFGSPSDIPFSDRVFTICETDCKRYGHSWACPPHAGDLTANIERIKKYHHCLVFSTIWEVTDAWNFDACLEVRKQHEVMTREIRKKVLGHFGLEEESLAENPNPDIYFLSAGCAICEECSCPDSECKHPKERLMTMESHGILAVSLVEKLGLTSMYDGTTTVYFTMILF